MDAEGSGVPRSSSEQESGASAGQHIGYNCPFHTSSIENDDVVSVQYALGWVRQDLEQ
jgi:hypothetical protein